MAEELSRALTPDVHFLRKSRLRALLTEGIDVRIQTPLFIEGQIASVTYSPDVYYSMASGSALCLTALTVENQEL